MIKKDFSKTGKVCKTTFTLPKEAVIEAKEVFLLGDFNNWDVQKPVVMKKQKDGSFATTVDLEIGRKYQFRYLIDRNKWENDWSADEYLPVPPFGIYNSVVTVNETIATLPTNGKPAVKAVKTTAKPAPKATVKTPAENAPAAKKEVVKVPVKTGKDDLKKIEGIGPKIEELLNKAGIHTFADVAGAKAEVLKGVLDAAGSKFKMHDPTTWTEQSKLAAAGNWEKLAKLQDQLKGGKK